MIVACSACRTRFRVADEKVGPRGARIRCSRCGQTFQVGPPLPPEPPPIAPEPTPVYRPEPAAVPTEPTGTGGWPTGVLEVAGASSDSSVGIALEADPFAAYATQAPPAQASGPADPLPPAPLHQDLDFMGSLPVTDLSDLERTGARLVPPEPLSGTDASVEEGLALEERTPGATPVREIAARWSDPEASQAIEVGPDGFQEVDLASGAARPDPEFDALAGEVTHEVPVAPPAPEARDPGVPGGRPTTRGAPEPPAGVASDPTSVHLLRPARIKTLAMNVLSLAALLLVTLGIVLWWRGDGIGALLRWPRAGHSDVDVGGITSGVYEGSHGQPLIFVRGVVRATHEPVEGPVTVRVVLERGGTPLGAATAVAGAVPSAEDLAAVTSPEGLAALRRQVDARAPLRLAPGTELPFLAVLPLPDGDVGTLHFRVDTLPERGR